MKFKRLFILVFIAILNITGSTAKQAAAATVDEASILQMNDKWSNIIEFDYHGNEVLWYKVNIPSDGILKLGMLTYSAPAVGYRLYSEDLTTQYNIDSNELQNGNELSPVAAVKEVAMTRGNYYLKLYMWSGYDDSIAKIKIKSSFKRINTNNNSAISFDSPQNINLGQKITGIMGKTNKQDWYRFTLKKKTVVQFKAKSYCGDYFTYDFKNIDAQDVYNGGNELQNASASSPSSAIKYYSFEKGTYYLVLTNYNDGLGGRYEFSLDELHKVDNVRVKKAKNQKAVVYWNKVEGAVGYEIYYGLSKNKMNKIYSQNTNVVLKNLKRNKWYYVKVRAYRKYSYESKFYGKWSEYKKFYNK